jgi:hypothetical protein
MEYEAEPVCFRGSYSMNHPHPLPRAARRQAAGTPNA